MMKQPSRRVVRGAARLGDPEESISHLPPQARHGEHPSARTEESAEPRTEPANEPAAQPANETPPQPTGESRLQPVNETLPRRAPQDTEAGWGEYETSDENERYRRERPPHWC